MTQVPNYKTINTNIFNNGLNVRDDLKNLTVDEIRAVQDSIRNPISICTLNVTGNLNVSQILRSAVIFGYKKMYIFGRKVYDKRGTVGSQNYIDLTFHDGLEADGLTISELGFTRFLTDNKIFPIFIDNNFDIVNPNLILKPAYRHVIHSIYPVLNKAISQGLEPCFIFGNEGLGIPRSLIEASVATRQGMLMSIGQRGVIRSLNVAVAAGIVMDSFSGFTPTKI